MVCATNKGGCESPSRCLVHTGGATDGYISRSVPVDSAENTMAETTNSNVVDTYPASQEVDAAVISRWTGHIRSRIGSIVVDGGPYLIFHSCFS
jgi:hypothetical protein